GTFSENCGSANAGQTRCACGPDTIYNILCNSVVWRERTTLPMKTMPLLGALIVITLACCLPARAQDTAFTYQGRLNENGQPANGNYDLRFAIHDAATNGNTLAGPITNAATTVSNGLFTATLDFGANVFDGSARWLEAAVRSSGTTNPFISLAPRQLITPAPYALFAPTAATANNVAANAVAAPQL